MHEGGKNPVNHWLHLFLSLFCCGLWLPIWLIIAMDPGELPYRCLSCGEIMGTLSEEEQSEEARRKRFAAFRKEEEARIRNAKIAATGKKVATSVADSIKTGIALAVTQFKAALVRVNVVLRKLAGDDDFMYRFYQIMLAGSVLTIAALAIASFGFGWSLL